MKKTFEKEVLIKLLMFISIVLFFLFIILKWPILALISIIIFSILLTLLMKSIDNKKTNKVKQYPKNYNSRDLNVLKYQDIGLITVFIILLILSFFGGFPLAIYFTISFIILYLVRNIEPFKSILKIIGVIAEIIISI